MWVGGGGAGVARIRARLMMRTSIPVTGCSDERPGLAAVGRGSIP